MPKVNNTIPDVKPEDVEALAKAVSGKKKRKIGFAEDTNEDSKDTAGFKETDLNQQKVIVELDSDLSTPKKKKFKNSYLISHGKME